jgi:hypothetical protein
MLSYLILIFILPRIGWVAVEAVPQNLHRLIDPQCRRRIRVYVLKRVVQMVYCRKYARPIVKSSWQLGTPVQLSF